jgi:hypothetical protein
MRMWPGTRWEQGWISFIVALAFAYLVFVRTEDSLFKQAVKEAPYDGQDGLSAFMGALHSGFFALIGAFVISFCIQRAITATVHRSPN